MEDEGDARAAAGFAVDGRGVEPQKPRARVMDLELVAHDALSAGVIEPDNLLPLDVRDEVGDRLALDIGLEAKKPRDGLVEVENMPGFIDDQHAVLDGVEEGFEKTALSRQALDDRLQSFGVDAPDAPENLVEETGFAGHVGKRLQAYEVRAIFSS